MTTGGCYCYNVLAIWVAGDGSIGSQVWTHSGNMGIVFMVGIQSSQNI